MKRTNTHADTLAAVLVILVIMVGSFLGTLGAGLILRGIV